MNLAWLYIALIVAGIAIAILLGWFLVEAIMSIRSSRRKVNMLLTKYSRLIENDQIDFVYIKGDMNVNGSRHDRGRHYGSRW